MISDVFTDDYHKAQPTNNKGEGKTTCIFFLEYGANTSEGRLSLHCSPAYFSLSMVPMRLKEGIVFQQVLTAHEPETP